MASGPSCANCPGASGFELATWLLTTLPGRPAQWRSEWRGSPRRQREAERGHAGWTAGGVTCPKLASELVTMETRHYPDPGINPPSAGLGCLHGPIVSLPLDPFPYSAARQSAGLELPPPPRVGSGQPGPDDSSAAALGPPLPQHRASTDRHTVSSFFALPARRHGPSIGGWSLGGSPHSQSTQPSGSSRHFPLFYSRPCPAPLNRDLTRRAWPGISKSPTTT